MALLRLAGDPTARRGRCDDLACAGPPAVGEPPPPSRPARGGPCSPDDATSAPWSAVAAQLVRCAANFDLLSKPFPDSDEVSEGEAVALLKACGFSAQDCTELLRDTLMVDASPDQCTTSTMPTPISLFAESDECGAPGAHCAPTNDTALSGMSSPLLPCSADTALAMTPRRQLAFLTTTDPLPPGSPLPQPATKCAPLRTAGLAAAAVIGSNSLPTMLTQPRLLLRTCTHGTILRLSVTC